MIKHICDGCEQVIEGKSEYLFIARVDEVSGKHWTHPVPVVHNVEACSLECMAKVVNEQIERFKREVTRCLEAAKDKL